MKRLAGPCSAQPGEPEMRLYDHVNEDVLKARGCELGLRLGCAII